MFFVDDMYTSASQEQSEKETKEDEMEDPLLENKESKEILQYEL